MRWLRNITDDYASDYQVPVCSIAVILMSLVYTVMLISVSGKGCVPINI